MSKAITKKVEESNLITWRDLDLPEALETVEDLQVKVAKLEKQVLAISVFDKPSYDKAAALLLQLKELDKQCETTVRPFTSVLERMKKYIWSYSNPVFDKVDELKKILNPRMGAWVELEEKRAAAERDRVARETQAALEREAELVRQKDEQLAKELRKKRVAEIKADLKDKKITSRMAQQLLTQAGDAEEAAIAKAAADEEDNKKKAEEKAKRIEVEPNIGTTAGISKRKYYQFTVTNPQKVAIKFLCPDEVRIGQVVRCCENDDEARLLEKEIGGIEISLKRTF